jgi:hypothetical protein
MFCCGLLLIENKLKAKDPGIPNTISFDTWSQSYDHELQRQRCKNVQHDEKPSAF